MKNPFSLFKFSVICLALLTLMACTTNVFAGATVVVINADGAGEGFNETTPATPVGGNPKTTKGEQRLYAFQFAADKWGATLDSNQTIYVLAAFNPLAPNVLGSAGAWDLFADFPGVGLHPGAEFPGTWYNSALADMRAGVDQDNTSPDIIAQFSSNFDFYLGVDNNHGAKNDLVAVLLHELGHGLGFQTFVGKLTGQYFTDPSDPVRYPALPDIYSLHLFDNTQNKAWINMTDEQRRVSIFNYGNLVWHGANVSADIPQVLTLGSPEVRIQTPAAIAGVRQFGTAAFGPPLSSPGVNANVVPAADAANAAGPATTDGCSPFTNAAAVAGKIALVERGTCGFAVKARNATNAGAIGVIIYNNAANVNAAPAGMADDGINGAFVTIPTVSLTRADGLAIVANLPVTAKLGVDLSIRAGADANGNARLYAPFPVATGSNVSHFDTVASRNLLMEPAINPDLTHNLTAPDDLTLELMRDIGWFPDADVDGEPDSTDCEPHSDLRPTVIIGGCDTGVPNIMFTTAPNRGCTLSDRLAHIAADSSHNHGTFVKNAQVLLNELKKNGTITAAQKDALSSCVGQANNP